MIIRKCLAVHRLVKLSFGGINSNLAEQRVQTKSPRLVRNDRHNLPANCFVAQQHREQTNERHRRGHFEQTGTFEKIRERFAPGNFQRCRRHFARRQETAEFFAPGQKIFHLRTVSGRTIKRHVGNDIVADRDVETPTELAEFLLVHFFLLMRNVFAFARFTEAVTLDRLGQDHRRLALVFHRGFVGRIHLAHVVTAAQQL